MSARTSDQCCPRFDPAPWDEKKIRKLYVFYTTYPKCARKYRKNYFAILART